MKQMVIRYPSVILEGLCTKYKHFLEKENQEGIGNMWRSMNEVPTKRYCTRMSCDMEEEQDPV